MTKMTVHEALCEIKVSDKRIEKAISECAFCAANKESSPKVNGVPVRDFEDEVRNRCKSIEDLIRRTEASKDFKARNEYKLVDPVGIVDRIAKLTEETDRFQAAVDSAIQISNATTYIEIED